MKKSLIALFILGLLACSLFVSCNSDVSAPEALSEELVSVTFDDGAGSKGLTATLEDFNTDNYYWKYAAKKADDSGLTSGETETYDEAGALPVSNGNPGLGSGTTPYKPYKVSGFSQGLWDFTLFAYKTKNSSGQYEDLVFTGEAKNVSLTKGGSNIAYVVVNPVITGNGIIKIGTISFVPKKAGDATSHTKVIEVTNPDGSAVSGITYDSTTQEYTVPAGAYKVTVKFTNSAGTIVYAEGYVIATVYSGLKTTVAGDLNELVTYAQFDAELNPDAVNAQAVSNAVTYDAGAQAQDVDLASSTSSEKTVTTTVKRADVNSIIEAMAAEQAVPTDASTTSLKLALNVDPTEATQTTVTYEIGMTATLTYQETSQSEAQVSEKSVIDLNNYIVVEIEMSTGLTQVNVTHSGIDMVQCDSLTALNAKTEADDTPEKAGFFYYDPAGTLYLKTKKFSPFAISYTAPTNYVASVDGVKYSTLEAAIDKASDTKKVTLLTDVALTSTVNTSKTFEIDLNGYSITAENFRAIWVKEGTLTLSGSGTIAANKVGTSDFSASSSVIRVGDTEGSSVGLVIGANVTVSSSHCYGVTIFGTEATEQSLVVNGKIKVTGTASAISGNGTSSWKPTEITINAGAEVSAENDYAIYQPQAGTLTINGGAISGKGGIEAKAGTVTVNGGVITATAPTTTHSAYGNGPSTSGYALVAVENNGYKGSVDITVNGGSFNGEVGIVVDEGCEFTDPTKKPKMNVVAQVNDKLFTTLQSAIDNATNGDTVYLIQDVTCGLVTIDGKQLTVEGNNYTINSTPERTDGEGRAMNIWGDGVDVSLRNLKINAPAGDNRGVNIGDIATVSMNNCTVVCEQYYAVNIVSQGSNTDPSCVTLSINNCELRGWAAINHHGSNSLITIEGSTLVGINNNSGATNAFATIVVDGNSLFNPGSTVSGNTVIIKDSTIVAKQNGDQDQDWISYQYGANNNTSTVSVSGTLILDKENGEDKSYSMNISGMGNTVVLPLSDASKAKINPKAFVVTETTTEGVYEVTNRIDVLYYWETTSGYAGGYHDIYSPFEKGWLADGEYIALVTDVSLLDDITCSLTSGSFYLLVGDHSFDGGDNHSIKLNAGVYILSDSANIGSLLKCGDKAVICDTEENYYSYHFASDGEIAKQMAIDAGADPDKVVVYDDCAIATMADDVEYVFYPDETISVYDTANYNGFDGTETVAPTKYTVGKLVKGVTKLGGGCFSNNTTITHVAFANDIVSAYKSFQKNSTIKVVDLTNLTSIPNRMFYGMSGVETFIVPDSVKRIDDWAFYANTGMKTIIVGQSVEYIGYKAFDGCSSLETVDILGSPEIVNWAGRGCTALKDLYLRGENTSYNMTYAPEGNNVGGFVIAKGQSGNPDTFGYTVHVYSKEVYNAFKLYNNQNNSTPTMEIINDIN